ncbi:MAG: winged helix-turn-helix domain-containing protein [Patescibacteria group bacterium]
MDSLATMQRIITIQPHSSPFPRRQEIVATIRENKMVSFAFLSRQFRLVPPSTLHYDLKQLAKAGFIQKMGSTRGVVYTIKIP